MGEAISNMRTVRAVSSEEHESRLNDATLDKCLKIGVKDACFDSLTEGFNSYLDLGAGVLILWYGGTIAMARTMDPHSATAQFFINVSDNDFLNFSGENMQGWGYAVFGRVVEGEDVLDKIRVVPTGSEAGHQDVPNDPIVIESVTVLSD